MTQLVVALLLLVPVHRPTLTAWPVASVRAQAGAAARWHGAYAAAGAVYPRLLAVETVPEPSQRPAQRRPSGPAWLDMSLRILIGIAMALLLALAGLLFFENRFVFRPSREPVESWQPPGPGVTECVFRARDGVQLHAWWYPGSGADDVSDRPVLLWCHGNSGNITHRTEAFRRLVEHGLAVLLFDYRGYGKSEGRPSEHGLYMDGEAAYKYLVEAQGIEPGRIVCFGRSLGSVVALHVALLRKTAGVVIEGAFVNLGAVVRHRHPVLPLALFVRNRLDNLGRVRRLKVPLLVVHDSRDTLVPIAQARAVFNAAPGSKEFYAIEGSGHSDLSDFGNEQYYQTLRRFCSSCVSKRGVPRAGSQAPREPS